ncbi:MAG: hypothetical protein HOA99_00535 [Candidatus Thioglobus sp.]|nr:hypothetical protein [Candidatus Thioglobus sp.]
MNLIKLLLSTTVVFYFTNSLAKVQDKDLEYKTWKKTEHGVVFSLKQLSVEQLNAFYYARGFSVEQIHPYAYSCAYSTVLQNNNALGSMHFVRSKWDISSNNKIKKIITSASWLQGFKQADVKPSALIAFRLSQLPEEQSYNPNGDWNQGILSVGLKSGAKFDIIIRWDVDNKPYEFTIQGVNCI